MTQLESITVDKDNPNFYVLNNCLIESATKTILYACTTSSIPTDKNVNVIGQDAFAFSPLKSIKIPDNITKISTYAFSYSSLEDIYIPPSVEFIGTNAFFSCKSLHTASIDCSPSLEDGIFGECSALKNITLPKDMDMIPSAFFNGCTSLEEINLPETVSHIKMLAFGSCTSLDSVKLPGSLSVIGELAFSSCENLLQLRFDGTLEEWDNITKHKNWLSYDQHLTVICTDGEIEY
jgi:hypothetical protein